MTDWCVFVFVGFRLTTIKAVKELDKWKQLEHVNLVSLKEMFTTKAFGDHCMMSFDFDCSFSSPFSDNFIFLHTSYCCFSPSSSLSSPPLLSLSPLTSVAVVFVYHFHSASETLKEKHLCHSKRTCKLLMSENEWYLNEVRMHDYQDL